MGEPLAGWPDRVGPYRIERRLGAGGMGVVFLGQDESGTAVAVKVVRPEFAADPTFRARLRREVDAARRVPRSCTAPVLGADPDGEPPWIATEYIDGPSLDMALLLEQGLLRRAQLDAVAVGVAVALQAIHEQGVIHRDLKPSNILLSQHGPRVIDFGIARVEEAGAQQTQLTQVGAIVGTPAYMAPEQLRGEPVTAAVDVFAWASLVTHAATGAPPFGTGDGAAQAILSARPELGDLDEPLRGLVVTALEKDPARRPSASGLVDELSHRMSGVATQVMAAAAAPPAEPPPVEEPPSDESVHSAPTLAPTDHSPTGAPDTEGGPASPPTDAPQPAAVSRPGRRTPRWLWPVAAGAFATVAVTVAATALIPLPLGDLRDRTILGGDDGAAAGSPSADPSDAAADAASADPSLADAEITIAIRDSWDEGVPAAYLMGRVFQDAGVTVSYASVPNEVVFEGMATGEWDIGFDAWLSRTHRSSWEEHSAELEDLGAWYDEAALGIAVNRDAPVGSLTELASDPDAVGNRIVGIDAGAGLTRVVQEQVIPAYGLEGMDFAESSTSEMLGELDDAVAGGENVAVTLWKPHWAYATYPIVNLTDPQEIFTSYEEDIHSYARSGFAAEFPVLAEWAGNLYLTDQQIGELLEHLVVEDDRRDPAASVEEWLDTQPGWVERLKAGELR